MNTLHQSSTQSNHTSSIPLFVSGRPKPVAYLRGNILCKGIQPDHILRSPRAIAFDAALLADAARKGAAAIKVTCEHTTYTTTLERFNRYAFSVNRKYGAQFALELARWSIDGETPELDRREQTQAMRDSQLSLFAEVAA